jgi:UPF0755 protein
MTFSSWQKKAVLLILLSGAALTFLGSWYYFSEISKPLRFADDVFIIKRGESLSSIANRLNNQGVIREPYTLKVYARLNKIGTRIKAGEYRFPDGISLVELADRLVTGKGQIGIKITIIEGWTFAQMREAINAAPKLKKYTLQWTDQQIMEEMGLPGTHPEGQFYPDTYHYRLGDSDISIYKKAFTLMQESLDEAWSRRQPDLQIKSRDEALILASIIEKETQVREEQPHISGVFDNRLRMGMRLQTDQTVIYGIVEEYDGDITRKHLKTDTPYNTYTRYGLPPTPICLVGDDSLYAAVHPKKTKSLYFVARGEGRHKFSETLEQHNAAVRKYILGKKDDG